MERIKRNERIAAMVQVLTAAPNRVFTLGHFCQMFSAAKSTISEDIDILQRSLDMFGLGTIETVTGAAGGVRYRPAYDSKRSREFLEGICERLSDPSRVLPGGFLYMADILADPAVVCRMGEILASYFYASNPSVVITMETMGIPVAMETARILGVPLVIARRDSKAYEGSAVKINYTAGSNGGIETMSLSRRAVTAAQRALIIDDFMKGGGTIRGMNDLMREFDVEVVGMGVVMSTSTPEKKRIDGVHALLIRQDVTEGRPTVVTPAEWI
ncbi:MAG TPA: pur operon repressor [Candidatus Fimadaptatus faecigallinarum]|uniref:Pur operon repressor n=1 Tax=Candidatus Fimadaptatus faecigallinarum TaxID=2840814 RepID=A0A9D1S4B1_9FIRM|nr:pur operon repressor [Candidatus Fimadaptatus faecigallinarum]